MEKDRIAALLSQLDDAYRQANEGYNLLREAFLRIDCDGEGPKCKCLACRIEATKRWITACFALRRLALAADAFVADQSGATHPQCDELRAALAEAWKVLEE